MMKRLKYGVFGLVALFFTMSFCSSDDIYRIQSDLYSIGGSANAYFSGGNCLLFNQGLTNYQFFDMNGTQFTSPSGYSIGVVCSSVDFYVHNTKSYGQSFYTLSKSVPFPSSYCGGLSCPDCPTCPEINTGEILSGYVLESEIDNLYCEYHGYCPIIDTGSVESGNWSALFINDIQHVSAPLINITIPEEFDWDYTGTDEEFDLDVKGYNVDTEYIDGIIRNQTTLPNTTDFNNTVSGLIPLFVPGLVIILLIYFIFRFIKKIF